jgi:UDP-N-acetylmuramoylalanine--D-glutamate ligase
MKPGTNIAILGAGESGVGAALLGKKLGMKVWLSDGGKIADERIAEIKENNLPYEEGGHTKESFFDADVIIKSPGIPDTAAIVQELRAQDKKLISEIEFAYTAKPELDVIAITGSNGKTTTTALIHHLLNEGGLDAGLGGNIGKSFARLLSENGRTRYVVEVSSFQLDDVESFRPRVAVLTNITSDHLDRYDYRLERYAAAKFRIAARQDISDKFIYNMDDPVTMGEMWKHPVNARKCAFSATNKPGAMAWLEGDEAVLRTGYRFDLSEMRLQGRHNRMNALAAILAARHMGVKPEAIQEGLNSFTAIEHRMELVPTKDGKTWINDSKGTNVDAVIYALDAVKTPTIWIAGGLDKGNDYSLLDVSRVKTLIILGPNKDKLQDFYSGKIDNILLAKDMEEAVKQAQEASEKGDTILLSPACSSFDIFKNFEERGRQFKEFIMKNS